MSLYYPAFSFSHPRWRLTNSSIPTQGQPLPQFSIPPNFLVLYIVLALPTPFLCLPTRKAGKHAPLHPLDSMPCELWEDLTSAFLFISTLGSFHLSEPSSSSIALKWAELKSIQDSAFFDICDLMAFISNFVLVLYGHLLNTGTPTDSTPATAVNCHLCVK